MTISWMQNEESRRDEPVGGDCGSPRFTPKGAVIVSRHPAAVAFIREAASLSDDVPVFSGNVTPEDIRGKKVYGNIPLALAALTREVVAVEFDGPPPRGQEYTLADMKSAGARLSRYVVQTWRDHREMVEGLVE